MRKGKVLDFSDRRKRQERGTCLRRAKLRGVGKYTSNVFLLFQTLSHDRNKPCVIIIIEFLTSQLQLGNIHLPWDM
jgi:hypothetical protein